MNRGKYINDDSYREGYLDGRIDGINAFKPRLYKLKEKTNYLEQRYYEIKKEIENKAKIGHWYDKCGNDACSVCGEEISDAQTFDGRPFKYCPMCGAPMIEP